MPKFSARRLQNWSNGPIREAPEFIAYAAEQFARGSIEQGIAKGGVVVIDPLELDVEFNLAGGTIVEKLGAGSADTLYHE